MTTAALDSSPLAVLPAEERENHVLKIIREAALSMHLDIQDDTPLMEDGSGQMMSNVYMYK